MVNSVGMISAPATASQGSTPAASILHEALLSPALGARRVSVAAGSVLYSSEQRPQSVFFLHRGQVRTYRIDSAATAETARLLEILGPGDWCGEAALANHRHYGEQAITVVPSVISEIPCENLLPALAQQPRWSVLFMRELAHKLTAAHEDAASLVFEDCHSRLLQTLVRFSRTAAASPHPEGVVLRITHQQLAQAVGVARETVSLALTQLRLQNALRTGRNQLMFDPERLRQLARKPAMKAAM